jgi:hypothetical protein
MRTIGVGIALVLSGVTATTALAVQEPARTVAAGVSLDVLLQTALSSAKVKVDQPFEAALLRKHEVNGQVVLEAGLPVRGFVSSVRPTSPANHQAQLTLSFESLRVGATPARLRATVVSVLDARRSDQLKRMDAGPVAAGIPDAGGTPLVGVFVGAGGTILATNGADISLAVGTILRIRLDQPLALPSIR